MIPHKVNSNYSEYTYNLEGIQAREVVKRD